MKINNLREAETVLNYHEEKFDHLMQSKIRQIEENRKISRRVDELEGDVTSQQLLIDSQQKIIKQLSDSNLLNSNFSSHYLKLCERIKQLEESVDFEKAKELIYQGAQTHASILKLESHLKIINDEFNLFKSTYSAPLEDMVQVNIENIYRKIDELEKGENIKKTPHKCPVCDGESRKQIHTGIIEPFEKRIIDSHGRHFMLCNACEGTGIVWG